MKALRRAHTSLETRKSRRLTFKVRDFMTPAPEVIGATEPIQTAIERMRSQRIRHLPVTISERLVGTVSDRVLTEAALSKWGNSFNVGDVMITDPYTITMDAELDDLVEVMIAARHECAVVMDNNGDIAGIFTAIDAMEVLREILAEHHPRSQVSRRESRAKLEAARRRAGRSSAAEGTEASETMDPD